MPDITLHLTANFYPPIPHDIQSSVQEFFDAFIEKAQPYAVGEPSDLDTCIFELADEDALNMEWELPNGRMIKAQHMLDELRLWEAVWWDCEPESIDDDWIPAYPEYKYEQLRLF